MDFFRNPNVLNELTVSFPAMFLLIYWSFLLPLRCNVLTNLTTLNRLPRQKQVRCYITVKMPFWLAVESSLLYISTVSTDQPVGQYLYLYSSLVCINLVNCHFNHQTSLSYFLFQDWNIDTQTDRQTENHPFIVGYFDIQTAHHQLGLHSPESSLVNIHWYLNRAGTGRMNLHVWVKGRADLLIWFADLLYFYNILKQIKEISVVKNLKKGNTALCWDTFQAAGVPVRVLG